MAKQIITDNYWPLCPCCGCGLSETDFDCGYCTQCKAKIVTKNSNVKYRILRPSDLVRYGDERWDFELGWTKVEDRNMQRFSREYRCAGKDAWRFRRPLTTISNQHHERKGGAEG